MKKSEELSIKRLNNEFKRVFAKPLTFRIYIGIFQDNIDAVYNNFEI